METFTKAITVSSWEFVNNVPQNVQMQFADPHDGCQDLAGQESQTSCVMWVTQREVCLHNEVLIKLTSTTKSTSSYQNKAQS